MLILVKRETWRTGKISKFPSCPFWSPFTHFSCFLSSLCALRWARTLLALLFRCSSLFCWIRASSLEMVQIPHMESLIPCRYEQASGLNSTYLVGWGKNLARKRSNKALQAHLWHPNKPAWCKRKWILLHFIGDILGGGGTTRVRNGKKEILRWIKGKGGFWLCHYIQTIYHCSWPQRHLCCVVGVGQIDKKE